MCDDSTAATNPYGAGARDDFLSGRVRPFESWLDALDPEYVLLSDYLSRFSMGRRVFLSTALLDVLNDPRDIPKPSSCRRALLDPGICVSGQILDISYSGHVMNTILPKLLRWRGGEEARACCLASLDPMLALSRLTRPHRLVVNFGPNDTARPTVLESEASS